MRIRAALQQHKNFLSIAGLSLLLCILSYALLIREQGFYWDDWPWMWFSHALGPKALLRLEFHRPLSGVLFYLGAEIFGETPLAWQIFTVSLRWLSCLALWWLLKLAWPERGVQRAWVVALFAVYPGFTQIYVSVNNSRHILGLVFLLLSFALSLYAYRAPRRFRAATVLSLAAFFLSAFMTEYYYGLELVRPVFFWLLVGEQTSERRERALKTLKLWAPYLAAILGVYLWRYAITALGNYQIVGFGEAEGAEGFPPAFYAFIILRDIFVAGLGAWGRIFSPPVAAEFGARSTSLYWGVAWAAGLGALAFLYRASRENGAQISWAREAIAVGLAALALGGIPFWATGQTVGLNFPSDRLALAMMPGSSLVLAGLLELVVRNGRWKIVLLSIAIGLAAGVHARSAVNFRRDWNDQAAFFRQLAWRAPGIAPGTTLITDVLPIAYSTDDSLTAPLNWIYESGEELAAVPYHLFYLDLRLGGKIPALLPGLPIQRDMRYFDFIGSTSNMVVLYHAPPACLRVLHPVYDREYPLLPRSLRDALPLSNLALIDSAPQRAATLPEHLYGPETAGSWCYYFQLADLARQQGDWARVAELGDTGFALSDSSNHASERVPFIEAYANVGRWEDALRHSQEAIEINRFMGAMLCAAWERILESWQIPEEFAAPLSAHIGELGCWFAGE
jgi:hypothetical protein